MDRHIMDGFEAYIRTELGLSDETFVAYTRDTKEFANFIGTQEVTAELVEKFVSHLQQRGLKSATVRRKIMSVRCLCHHLISKGKLDKNIFLMIDSVRLDRRMSDVIDDKSVDTLVATVESRVPVCRATNIRRDVAVILILHHSGLRASELCSLDVKDVNMSHREIRVFGKGCRERVVPTTHRCIEAIQDYVDNDRQSETSALFVKANGKRITRRAVSDMLMGLSRRAGVPNTTAHVLRRSCATSLMDRGVELELIQTLLGHQSLSTTQTYLVINNDKLAKIHKQCHPFGEGYDTQQEKCKM